MRHSNITATSTIDNIIVLDRDISLLTMAKTISKKGSVKASSVKLWGKPPPGDKNFGIETAIRFYAIEDGDETEKGEESEILVVYDSSLASYKQILVKRHSPPLY